MTAIVIGMVGLIGSGKGTVGDILVNDYHFKTDSFAKPLKDAVSQIFGWDRTLIEGATPESRAWREQPDEFWSKALGREMTPRLALQLMGTEAGRDVFGKNLWTAALINRLNDNCEQDHVITDVRFANEVDTLSKHGAVIVRIKRGPEPEWMEEAKREQAQYSTSTILGWKDQRIHRSEWGWVNSPVHYTIENDGSLEDLKNKVRIMLESETSYFW